MARFYKSYTFIDKDPVIDVLRTQQQKAKLDYAEIAKQSYVSEGTLYNWFHGTTKRPQFATVAAVAIVLGMDSVPLTAREREKAKRSK